MIKVDEESRAKLKESILEHLDFYLGEHCLPDGFDIDGDRIEHILQACSQRVKYDMFKYAMENPVRYEKCPKCFDGFTWFSTYGCSTCRGTGVVVKKRGKSHGKAKG